MKKFLLLPLVALAMMVGVAPASAVQPIVPGPTPQLKVDICHNGTIVPVSINAVATAQDTGHGLLTLVLGPPPSFTFVAHVEGQGHATDHVTRVYIKAGNTETLIVAGNGDCDETPPPPPPDPLVRVCVNGVVETIKTSLQVELGLTILGEDEGCPVVPPVVVEKEVPVEKIVEKVVEVPGPTQVIEKTITVEKPVPVAATPPAATPSPAAPAELPRTGGGSFLLLLGSGVTALGLVLRRLFK